jgi:hypothetical protein
VTVNHLQVVTHLLGEVMGVGVQAHELDAGRDHPDRIVDLVRDAGGQGSERGELLGLGHRGGQGRHLPAFARFEIRQDAHAGGDPEERGKPHDDVRNFALERRPADDDVGHRHGNADREAASDPVVVGLQPRDHEQRQKQGAAGAATQ